MRQITGLRGKDWTLNIVPILMYHNLGDAPVGAKLPGLYVKARAFAWQMRMLRSLGYRGVSMSAALPYLEGSEKGRVVAITFDDGYRDTADLALPILSEMGWGATCYVVSSLMGQYNAWDADALHVRKPLMSADQLRQWRDAGMEIGAHTRTHARLTGLDDDALEQEISGCKTDLENLIGQSVAQFCYPYGVFDDRVVHAVEKAGHTAAVTTHRGRARTHDGLFRLRRVVVSGANFSALLALKLLTPYEDRRG